MWPGASLKHSYRSSAQITEIENSPRRAGTAGDDGEEQLCPGDGCSFCSSNLDDGDGVRFMDA